MAQFPDKRVSPDLPRRVLFLNDVSFQYGAGVAQARQVESLLSLGIETGVLAWAPHRIELETVGTRPIDPDLWLGICDVDHLQGGKKLSDQAVIAGLMAEVARFNPEVIIVGNLHAARWPFQLLPSLAAIGCRVVTFLHDAYLYTGRCAYPGSCRLYLTGCDESCPTATQYPALEPALIPAAWRIRREIFSGPRGLEVAANSHWNKAMFQAAIPSAHKVEAVELGADELVYQPGDKTAARRNLGLPLDRPVILCAAVNFQEERKGCQYLREIIRAFGDTVTFAAFGHNAGEIPGLLGLGYHLEAHKLAQIYQAADLFLGTATEEAFGQTLMEAQLCGLPVVAFQTGGVVEIVRHGITGQLVRNRDVSEAVAALRCLLDNAALRSETAIRAREYAVSRFSVAAHAGRWQRFLSGRLETGTGHHPPVLAYPLGETDHSQKLDQHRPSWPCADTFLSADHGRIFAQVFEPSMLLQPGLAYKLFEMGYQAGDVILEVGAQGSAAAGLLLRGALANPNRTLRPAFFGINCDSAALTRARDVLISDKFGEYCHLVASNLDEFFARWSVLPTMVSFETTGSAAEVAASLSTLTRHLRTNTPVLVHGFLPRDTPPEKNPIPLGAEEWEGEGLGRFMGCFGSCALFITRQKAN